MKKINLRELYPLYYKKDYYIEVTDAVAAQFDKARREEHAYKERTRAHKAYYSLDMGDGIENDILFIQASPTELYERKLTNEELYAAISKLPEKQAKRVYAHYLQNVSMTNISKIENVSVQAIQSSITKGLQKIYGILKKN